MQVVEKGRKDGSDKCRFDKIAMRAGDKAHQRHALAAVAALLIREWRPKLPQPSSRTGTFWYWPTPRGGVLGLGSPTVSSRVNEEAWRDQGLLFCVSGARGPATPQRSGLDGTLGREELRLGSLAGVAPFCAGVGV
ncbi:hypothetical protein ACCO45_009500 [Purpureocillium lilacinum]|uniref:Uncharacterized protein n=1 Tax=Purpureocillium lilacinum TaxID=33203 RepID=A0ACC4DM77_PURLI